MEILFTPAPQGIVVLMMVVGKLWFYSRDLKDVVPCKYPTKKKTKKLVKVIRFC